MSRRCAGAPSGAMQTRMRIPAFPLTHAICARSFRRGRTLVISFATAFAPCFTKTHDARQDKKEVRARALAVVRCASPSGEANSG
jgi:hypothetical protein